MKKSSQYLTFAVPVFGVAALFLRYRLYRMLSADGLLPPFHPLEIGLWILTAVTAALVFFSLRSAWVSASPAAPEGILPAVGAWLLALAIFFSAIQGAAGPVPAGLYRILCAVCGLCLAVTGYFRLKKQPSPFGCHGAAALFFAIHAISRYQMWSSDPQLQNYVFSLFGCICLMLFAYENTALEVGIGSGKRQQLFGLLGCYCCCAALPAGELPLLYLAGAIWMLTGLCEPKTKPEESGERN